MKKFLAFLVILFSGILVSDLGIAAPPPPGGGGGSSNVIIQSDLGVVILILMLLSIVLIKSWRFTDNTK